MKKKIFIFLCSLVVSHAMYGMESTFKKNKQERHATQKSPYNKDDQEKLKCPLSTITAGAILSSAGCILQEPLIIGLGVGLMIGSTDDISHYYKYQRRYNQNIKPS